MKIIVKYTLEDVYQAIRLGYFSSNAKYVCILIGLLALIAMFIFNLSADGLVFLGIVSFIFLSYPYLLLRFYSDYQLKKTPILQSIITYEIDEDGIRCDSEISKEEIKWGAYVRARNNKKILLLYINHKMFHFIPKRVVSSENWQELLKLVDNKVKK